MMQMYKINSNEQKKRIIFLMFEYSPVLLQKLILSMGKYSWSDNEQNRREARRPIPKPRTPIAKKPRKEIIKEKANNSIKVRGLLNTDQNKFVENQAAADIVALQNFFAECAKELDQHPYCMECGTFIPRKYYRSATAHVLPKRKEYGFTSVASNIINKLFLGAGCGCHSKYDSDWEAAATMKVWPMAVEIFTKLYPLLKPEEKKNIPEVLLQELKPR
jgi:hypothetical protein